MEALARLSHAQPLVTYATNVMGTVHLLEAARGTGGVRGIVAWHQGDGDARAVTMQQIAHYAALSNRVRSAAA